MASWLRWFRRAPETVVPMNWRIASEATLELLARRYSLYAVQRDLQGPNKRFPAFKNEFFAELTKRL